MRPLVCADERNLVLPVTTEIDVVRVRRAAKEIAISYGFSRQNVYHIVISASELATNLIAHTDCGGRISISGIGDPSARPAPRRGRVPRGTAQRGVELLAEDDGPGIADIELAMRNGYSTAGTLGIGLPGVRRLMSEFAIHSQVGSGTRVVARKWLPCE